VPAMVTYIQTKYQLNNSRPCHVFRYLKFIACYVLPHRIAEKYTQFNSIVNNI